MGNIAIDTNAAMQNVQELFFTWGPRIFGAIIILILAHLIATAVKWGFAAIINRLPFSKTANAGADKKETLGARIGEIGYWLIWLIGMIAVLNTLGLQQVAAPLHKLVAGFFEYIPNLVGAGIVFFVGWVVAMVARKVLSATISAFNIEPLIQKFGLGGLTSAGLAKAVGQLVFVLIIIPVAISALEALKIKSISDPAVAVLGHVLDAIPKLIGASIILAVAFLISRWIASLIEQTLPHFGFDNSVKRLGLFADAAEDETPATQAVAWVAGFAVVLFAAIEAAKMLQFQAGADVLLQILSLGGRILFGGVIIAAGAAIANLIANGLKSSGGQGAGVAATVSKYAMIALSTAMGLRFMGIADDIINMAFGLILGAGAVAFAISFGWGGRETAAKLIDKWLVK